MSTNKKKKNTKGDGTDNNSFNTTNDNDSPSPGGSNNIRTEEEAVAEMKRILHTQEKIDATNNREEKKYYRSMERVLEQHLREEYRKGTYHSILDSLKRLVHGSGAGLYALLYKEGVPLKIGMSLVERMLRANQQNFKEAFGVADVSKVKEMCPDDSKIVNNIKNLAPKSMNYFNEKEGDRTLLMQLQVTELFTACIQKTSTGTAGERLMQYPSDYIQELTTLLSPEKFRAKDIAFLVGDGKGNIDFDKLFKLFLSWSTYRYDLHKRREKGEEILIRFLPEQPEDEFLKKHMLRRLLGGKERVSTFVDALEDSVRLEQMAGIIEELKKELAKAKEEELIGEMTDETREALCGIIKRINKDSDDYKHYKEPERQVIAEAAALQLRDLIKNNTGEIIVWERHMYNAVEQYEPEAYAEFFPPSSSEFVEVLKSDHLLRITVKLSNGRVVKHLIIRSFFRIFAEETSLEVVLSEIEAYIGTLSYLCAAGIISQEYAQREALVMQTYLMEYEGLGGDIENGITEGSFRYARQHAVGKGLCKGGSPENVRSVATVLGIGYLETLDICSQVGNESFGLLLNAHGITDGHNNPMNESFACQGVMAAGSLKARPCPHQGCDRDDMPFIFVAGIKTKDWALPHKFGCKHCIDATYYREVAEIEQRIDAQELGDEVVIVTEAQRKRYENSQYAKSREVTALKKRADAGDEKLTSSEKKRVEKREQKNAKSKETTQLMKQDISSLSPGKKARVEKRKERNDKKRETTQLMKQDISSLSTDEKVRVEKRKQYNTDLMKKRDNKRQKSGKTKQNASVPWTVEEDETILQSVPTGAKWANIAAQLVGRTHKQVFERWTNVLNPKLDKKPFNDADDICLWKAYNKLGNDFARISREDFKGKRSPNQVKNRFNGAAFKRFVSKKYGCDAYMNAKNAWNH